MYDEDKSTFKIEAKYDYSEGILEINIPDIIAELPEDDRKELSKLQDRDCLGKLQWNNSQAENRIAHRG